MIKDLDTLDHDRQQSTRQDRVGLRRSHPPRLRRPRSPLHSACPRPHLVMKHALMLGNILNKEETREAEAEIRELPGDEKWLKKDREREGGRMDWRKGKGKGRRGEKEEVKSIGSSQPWVGIMRARWVFVCRSYISC